MPAGVAARLAVEPGASMGWWRWVGDRGDVLGLDHFGASAPGARVLAEFGFSVQGIADRARGLRRASGRRERARRRITRLRPRGCVQAVAFGRLRFRP